MVRFPSGQREQTVNLPATLSMVRIHLSPPLGRIAQLGEHLPYKQGVTGSIPVATTIKVFNGSVAQLVRVPACHAGGRGFEPLLSRHIFGPLVKRLRHHPFTVVTGVRFSYGSPTKSAGVAQW